MTSSTTSRLLSFALLAVVLVAAAAPGPAHAAGLRDRLGLRARKGKAVADFAADILKDAISGGNAKEAGARNSVKLLHQLYSTTAIAVTSGANLKASVGVTDDMHGFNVREMPKGPADELASWLKQLRAEFPPGGSVHPKVQVRGGGPAGLAAALYARAGGAATVHVVEKRSRYFRQHVVSTWEGKNLGKANAEHGGPNLAKVTPDGMEHLFGKIGMALPNQKKSKCTLPKCMQYKIFQEAVPQERLGNDGRKIMVSDLEKLLATVGRVVGVTFTYGALDAADPKRSTKRASAWSAAITAFPQAPTCAAQAATKAVQPNAGDYDILIGAEGASSSTRAQYLGGKWVTPRCWVAHKTNVPTNMPVSLAQAKSEFIRLHGGLFSVGAVVKDKDFCNNKVGTASVFANVPADTGLAGAGDSLYRKPFTPDAGQDSYCQVELTFKEAAARHLKRAFGDGCGFNYNLLSATEAKRTTPQISVTDTSALQPKAETLVAADQELRSLVLVREVLKRVFVPDKVEDAFKAATEFKVWDNALRMSVATGDVDTYRPLPLVHKVAGGQLVMVVGDALRDALPDSGMGVNDAHHMATKVGEIVKQVKGASKVKNDNTGWAKPAVTAALSTLAEHERNIVCALHKRMDLVAQLDNLAAQSILTAHDSLKKLVADKLEAAPSTELTLSA